MLRHRHVTQNQAGHEPKLIYTRNNEAIILLNAQHQLVETIPLQPSKVKQREETETTSNEFFR